MLLNYMVNTHNLFYFLMDQVLKIIYYQQRIGLMNYFEEVAINENYGNFFMEVFEH